MSEIRQLAQAVKMFGESCARLSDADHGAVASLKAAKSSLYSSYDAGDLVDGLDNAAAVWDEIEAESKAAAMEARRFGVSLAN
ncbi:MAG: hypothetical protein ACTIID_14395 [Brevibacterium linens]|uniref:hypothetical protein n=1 Tax=Brevibacterium linens TaxID=1703 RepID=UPI003F9D8FEA